MNRYISNLNTYYTLLILNFKMFRNMLMINIHPPPFVEVNVVRFD